MKKYLFLPLCIAAAFTPFLVQSAIDRIGSLPPYDHTADVGKVPAISSTGAIAWSAASGVSGAAIGAPTGVSGNLVAFSGTGGKQIANSGVPAANVVLVSRAVLAGTGLTVTNSGLLSADITMSMSTPVSIANGGTAAATAASGFANLSPLTTKGDIHGYSTLNTRLAVGTTGQQVRADSTATTGLAWSYDHGGLPGATGASAGDVGEIIGPISRVRSAGIALTTATGCNVGANTCPATGGTQSITLTPGIWTIVANVDFNFSATTSASAFDAAVSKTSNTRPGNDTMAVPTACEYRMQQSVAAYVPGTGADYTMVIPSYECTVAAGTTTTLYLVGLASFTVSGLALSGYMYARRVR